MLSLSYEKKFLIPLELNDSNPSLDLNRKMKKKSEISKESGESISDERALKKKFSFHEHLDFLRKHNKLFAKPTYNSGDADNYFRNILRSCDPVDLFKGISWKGKNSLQLSKSVNLTDKKPLKRQTKSSPSLQTRKKVHKSVKYPSKLEEKSLKEEPEVDTFRSKSTQYSLKSKSSTSEEDKLESSEDENESEVSDLEEVDEKSAIMADDTSDVSGVSNLDTDMGEEEMNIEEGMGEVEVDAGPVDPANVMKHNSAVDQAILMELEDAEKQAKLAAAAISELKKQITELLKKEQMTDVESKDLEEKNKDLKKQMCIFEEKTRRIQFLLGQSNLFEKMISPQPPLQRKHVEDALPKVLFCGITEDGMPKMVICDDKKKARPKSASIPPRDSSPSPERPKSNSQEMRSKFQLGQSQTPNIAQLQQQLANLQNQMQTVCQDNYMLNEKLKFTQGPPSPPRFDPPPPQQSEYPSFPLPPPISVYPPPPLPPQVPAYPSPPQSPKMSPPSQKKSKGKCGRDTPCPAILEDRVNEYSEKSQFMDTQLDFMENEVKKLQNEIVMIQKEREHLEEHRKLLCRPPCPSPCPPCRPCSPPCGSPCPPCGPCGPCPPICIQPCCLKHCCTANYNDNKKGTADQQLSQLKEQYCRLQDDFKGKLTEVAGLRTDNESLKTTAQKAEDAKKEAEAKMKELEKELSQFKSTNAKGVSTKEQLIEQEQQLIVAKQRFREAQDELEELRAFIEDLKSQMDDYRNKYLESEQKVEEQKRQISMMEMEHNRITEQINLEIHRVKNQFQEKLQELAPLPDILKTTQVKLQEAQQMHLLAERNNEALTNELETYKDKVREINDKLLKMQDDQKDGASSKSQMEAKVAELEAKLKELQDQYDGLQENFTLMEEKANENEKKYQEKLHEIAQLSAQLESVREESARQVSRTKDRCETVRRSMQNQITDLERQLVQSRAKAKMVQCERDEIRKKMQAQIQDLNKNFEDAQMRINSLQGHVNYLKTSQAAGGDKSDTPAPKPDPCTCGVTC